MSISPPESFRIPVGEGAAARDIAVARRAGKAPGMFWLGGFRSDMAGSKATALDTLGAETGLAVTRFDYSGHGRSGGRFEDGTISRWLEETREVFLGVTKGPQIVVGSSMGGYLALLLFRNLLQSRPGDAGRILALALIAPAWDMTEKLMWARFPEPVRREITDKGVYFRPSQYSEEPYAITRGLIEDGRQHLIGDAPFDPGRPVHILHGLQDPDVPWEHALDLVAHLTGDCVRVSSVPDGDHRLSRPQDLELLASTLDVLVKAKDA